jgi:hypothetical protein
MTDFAVAALTRKRAELAGEIEATQARLDQMRGDLVHLDAAIQLLAPTTYPELIPPKKPSRKGCYWFGRGELGRLVLDVLREAQEPMRSVDVARVVMERRGMPAGAARLAALDVRRDRRRLPVPVPRLPAADGERGAADRHGFRAADGFRRGQPQRHRRR